MNSWYYKTSKAEHIHDLETIRLIFHGQLYKDLSQAGMCLSIFCGFKNF